MIALTPAGPDESLDMLVTPRAWRAAALGVLAGGLAVGVLSSQKRLGSAVTAITAGLALGCAIPVALASRRPPITPDDAADALVHADSMPRFSIVVGARDEAPVLARLIADVSRQDYRAADGTPLFELIVVDDRSTDGTAEAVAAAAAEYGVEGLTHVVLRRGAGLPDGKGAALTSAQPDICGGDVLLVLYADARL